MRETVREYVYAFLMLGTAVLLIVGVVVFQAAVSVEAYVAALVLLAMGGLTFLGARKLKGQRANDDLQGLSEYMSGKNASDKGARNGK